MINHIRIVLGSRSPQRSALLKTVIPADQFDVQPPISDDELGFDGLQTIPDIEDQLQLVVNGKFADIVEQLRSAGEDSCDRCVICADTIVVATAADGTRVVLGKPPEKNWKHTVRSWFTAYYADKPHQVWTNFRVGIGERIHQETVKTELTLHRLDENLINWYLETDEPIGKAGGYGVQDIASMFVKSMTGSLTNVIGLPMFELTTAFRSLGVISLSSS